ncbi:MAG: dynamin family protein [Burkholderiales bacterium]|nr:dynamin family protein [Burkholderiales bacterium]
MTPTFASNFDALSGWRSALSRRLGDLAHYLTEHDLADGPINESLVSLGQRLAGEKLVVAFVAEFSRGKSELINAMFFADAGRRVLPASPGRTTMCPVELAYDPEEPPLLSLLPITTRLEGLSLGELRAQPRAWTNIELNVKSSEELSNALKEVMRTRWVTQDEARTLGFWDDARPSENPPLDGQGRVEVPEWRHALINYPHPLLKQGLVVLDTPGLNAIGAEPELTLSLLPSAHATVFILGADTGVTKSDMEIWRDHLDTHNLARFVVLNKIDALIDPLSTAEQISQQIESQRQATARTLEIAPERVFPLSARQALTARMARDREGLAASRLTDLEEALSSQLLPRRRQVIQQVLEDAVDDVETHVTRRIGDSRRQLAEQMLELRGIRGKSGAKVRLMLSRIEDETAEFELCTTRLQALRMVHARMLKDALVGLSGDRLREEVGQMQEAMAASILNLGAKKAFIGLCNRLRALLDTAQKNGDEIRDMIAASFTRLNAEFGFGLSLPKGPELERYGRELALIERNYVQYLGLTQALRLSQPKFMEQFRRMLVSKLRVVFENACAEFELWSKGASAQVDSQLRERRRGFRKRREALERIQSAAGELEQRIAEIETQDQRLHQYLTRVNELVGALRKPIDLSSLDSFDGPQKTEDGLLRLSLPPSDEPVPMLLRHAQG